MFRNVFKHQKSSEEELTKEEEQPADTATKDNGAADQTSSVESIQSMEPEINTVEEKEETEEVAFQQEDESMSMANLFTQTEEHEDSGMGMLLNLAPETTIQELMDDMEEIKTMLHNHLSSTEEEHFEH